MDKKITTTGKKTNPIVIVVIALVVLAGLYYGATRWRQQQYINQLAKLYGGNGGLIGNLTGGGNGQISDKLLKEIADQDAKNEAEQKKEEDKEAAKTPQDKFNETKSMTLTDSASSMAKSVVEPELIAVFGKIKPTLFSGNYMGQGSSFLVVYKVPKVITSDDMNKLIEELTKNGYTAGMNSIEAEAAQIIMEKDGNSLSVGYENPTDQEITVLYIDQKTNN